MRLHILKKNIKNTVVYFVYSKVNIRKHSKVRQVVTFQHCTVCSLPRGQPASFLSQTSCKQSNGCLIENTRDVQITFVSGADSVFHVWNHWTSHPEARAPSVFHQAQGVLFYGWNLKNPQLELAQLCRQVQNQSSFFNTCFMNLFENFPHKCT